MGDDRHGWLAPQRWQRDGEGPCVTLGDPGAFDDMHIFAPCVAYEGGRYWLWYCGSQGAVEERVFRLGLATSDDGVHFRRHPASPIYGFGDDRHSVLTPTLLRSPDGAVLREGGQLRMWFAATDLSSRTVPHTLHESTSADSISWAEPSEAQMENVYASTIIAEGDTYRMWYTDVTVEPWCIRHAHSADGRRWHVSGAPALQVDQDWEAGRLFYPTVVVADGLYLMWYGSYHGPEKIRTALGLAISEDGLRWHKSAHNPLFGPKPSREWESHYTTSQSVMRLPDSSWRIWYASRTKPPFIHKYLAICTAHWSGPDG